ncbi:HNH endonuclease [Bibersteinia trehalosi]|uniref:HNH endonuclease n=1 Tax=Bibersteinia trehalosi TaxID=47735 RepID=A0A426FIC5_BIBTR|nr:HNH endonuclease [Bibersteinia trehalosi]RRN03846.1 HNH endonuclease [Bibersteinia trehalosi]
MNYLNKLINISSESIKKTIDVKLPLELKKLYSIKNGFIAFENTLRIYDTDTMLNINRLIQEELCIEGLFFGDNSLGDGFCIKDDEFYKYDFELGELEFIGKGIEEFSCILLSKYNYYTGYSLAKEWMETNKKLEVDHILMPIIPFSLGGEYSVENLVSYSRYKGIKIKTNFCKKISKYGDGMQINVEDVYNLRG